MVFVLGAVVGFGVLVGSVPGPGAEADEIRDFLDRSDTRVWAGGYIGLLAQVVFLVFAAGLWGILRRAEGGTGWISTAGLVSAGAFLAIIVAGDLVPGAAVFYAGRDVDPATASLLLDAKKLAEILSVPFIGLFLASAAIVVLRAAALPRWAGWSAALIAALSVVTVPLGYEPSQTSFFLALLWIPRGERAPARASRAESARGRSARVARQNRFVAGDDAIVSPAAFEVVPGPGVAGAARATRRPARSRLGSTRSGSG